MDKKQSSSNQVQDSVTSIIKYGEPTSVSSGVPRRSSVFTHPRELEDPSSHPLARKMSKHGIPKQLVSKKSPRRHSEIVVSDLKLMQHLNEICAPKEWTENSTYYVQTLEKEPSSREETIELGRRIDTLLNSRRAKHSGICAIRREIFSQLFDELLRQVSTENLLWGKMLLRIRNEVNMTLEAYGALFSNSVSFGRAHFIEKTMHLPKQRAKRDKLKAQIESLKQQIENAKSDVYQMEKRTERMQKSRDVQDKWDRDKMMKLRQSFIVAFDNLDPLTVTFGSPARKSEVTSELKSKRSDQGLSHNDKSQSEVTSELKSKRISDHGLSHNDKSQHNTTEEKEKDNEDDKTSNKESTNRVPSLKSEEVAKKIS